MKGSLSWTIYRETPGLRVASSVSTNLMERHVPYEQIRMRPCDFVVKYRFLTKDEGGRQTGLPIQGIRSDFMYYGDNPKTDSVYMIHPEFLDKFDNVITEKIVVSESGKALMWIINPIFNDYHKTRFRIGTKGYFMEEPRITAECEVKELIGLK